MTTVSVVIPLWNAAPFIGETLDSVASQTHVAHEVIVVDDGSTDGGARVAERHALRPRVLTKPNGGPASARNAGIRAATGELVALLDADDLWLPTKLERQVAFHRENPDAGLLYSDYARFEDVEGARRCQEERRRPRESLRELLIGNQVPTLTAAFPRRVFDAIGPFDESRDLVGVEDYHYWLRIVRRFPARHQRETLALHRVREGSLVGQSWERNVLLSTTAVERFLESEPLVTRELYGLSSRAFVRYRTLRALGSSLKRRGVSWSARWRVLKRAL